MKIKMKTRAAGQLVAEPGDELDVDPAVAKELIAGNFAEAVGAAAKEKTDGPEADGGSGAGGREPRKARGAEKTA